MGSSHSVSVVSEILFIYVGNFLRIGILLPRLNKLPIIAGNLHILALCSSGSKIVEGK